MVNMNCRNTNVCAFCKHWLGASPNVDYRTGESKVSSGKGLCAKDESGRKHTATDVCPKFSRALSYM